MKQENGEMMSNFIELLEYTNKLQTEHSALTKRFKIAVEALNDIDGQLHRINGLRSFECQHTAFWQIQSAKSRLKRALDDLGE